jgi:nucleotide-binding universal stress UspA family protein
MFTTVVVGTNWSETAEIALAKALEITRASDGRLHVVTGNPPSPPPASGRAAGASGGRSFGPDFQADVVLERTLDRLGANDVDVKQHTLSAEPADAILAIAEQVGADLIVVGNQGMHRRVLGSIPNTVSHRAACDVLIVQTG